MTTVMFVGMSFCLPLAFFLEHRQRQRAQKMAASTDAAEPLLAGNGEGTLQAPGAQHSELAQALMLLIPTAFDLIATVLMNVGLLSVTASVYQMMRGAEMLFAALFAVVFLRRSQCVQAAQITFEDFFMADLAIPPLKIVGYEGVLGASAMLLLVLPIVQRLPGVDGQGLHEDSVDTWHMITHSSVIATVLIVDAIALLMYNVSGMCVTGHLGAVFRTVLETTRTLFVWLVDLVLFYTPLGMGKLGESWSVYSWIQAAGFVVLVTGTVVYGKGDEAEMAEEIAEGHYVEDTEQTAAQPTLPPAVQEELQLQAAAFCEQHPDLAEGAKDLRRATALVSPPGGGPNVSFHMWVYDDHDFVSGFINDLGGKVKVGEFEMARLDDLLGDAAKALAGQAGVMKIDVEGYESKAYGGGACFMSTVRPEYILAEINGPALAAASGATSNDMFELYTSMGYELRFGNQGFDSPIQPPSSFDSLAERSQSSWRDANFYLTLKPALKPLQAQAQERIASP
ncbi:hypothetical protein CHLNCDRAFT_142917 [Chlorella variabilis]|uniref:Methyltransferase FkbM domain-containing protein n=1 Tax=Chlorella variabilis TaxID=554065 RepID=E1Z923_CHLVA|nr:hypothetical protein CHLNCDRAFT_142917 [Chlorella variabilis]EFN57441.1 hypothetical protein CHLNCDRAFT_142917 [Chlorella variabilis]|eukprot:XP_005849543.1 hypothetical protein CHLNCDRAFT_142917 [Chlorella variabilis]